MPELFVNDVEYGQMFSPRVEILMQQAATMECKAILRIQKVALPSTHLVKVGTRTYKAPINKTHSIIITVSN